MMEFEGDKVRTSLAMAVARMWKDPDYKREFISDPKSALSREGVNFADNTLVKVVEETPAIKYVDLGSGNAEPQQILGQLLPLSDGQEIRIVQSTDNLRYLVLPAAPGWIAPGFSGGNDLSKLSFDKVPTTVVSEETVIGTSEDVVIDSQAQEVVVTETTELVYVSELQSEVQVVEIAEQFEAVAQVAETALIA